MSIKHYESLDGKEIIALQGTVAEEYAVTCSNYRDLQSYIMDLSIEQLESCIAVERAGRKRHNILHRLHMRYCEARKNQERKVLFT